MSIPRKLGFSFLTVIASAAIMMLVFYTNISMIRSSTDNNNLSQSIYAKALTLETSILRQNSQFRGFLVTADPSYLKSYYEARDEYDKTSGELGGLLTDPTEIRQVNESRQETLAWRKNWGDRLIARVRAGDRDGAQAEVRGAGEAVLVSKVAVPLRKLRATETALMDSYAARQETAISTAKVTLFVGGLVLIGIATTLAMVLSGLIARPISGLTRLMAELAAGKNDITVPDADRKDELGDMARAVIVFRDAAVTKLKSDADQELAMRQVGDGLHRLAEGDLTVRVSDLPEAFQQVQVDFNGAVAKLSEVLGSVRSSIEAIKLGATEISQASTDLSHRTEQQAASLEETAAAMDEITSTVKESAASATQANAAMAEARTEAQQGGLVVSKAVDAMRGIDRASQEISEIIAVIDGIAFQTNLLALNAGVEAARAGDAGKGFAVVASEVRALAQRSADAAKDVKTRIQSATGHVKSGVELVDETGHSLSRIIDRVTNISSAIGTMARSSDQQASGLGQVNLAIGEMDGVTQQNAAMVEQATAAARSLAEEADELARAVSHFVFDRQEAPRLAERHRTRPASTAPTRSIPVRRPSAAPRVAGNLAMTADDDWSAF